MDIIPFVFPGLPNVRCVFSTRGGGGGFGDGNISFAVGDNPDRVAAARSLLLQHLACEHFAELNQVHGDILIFEPDAVACDAQPRADGDGMATSAAGLALVIRTADCQPLLLAHNSCKYVAALHVGWRGNRCIFRLRACGGFAKGTPCPRRMFWQCAGQVWGRQWRSLSILSKNGAQCSRRGLTPPHAQWTSGA